MQYDITQALIDLTAAVSHDEEQADWYDVHEMIDLIPNAGAVLRDLLHWVHEEGLI